MDVFDRTIDLEKGLQKILNRIDEVICFNNLDKESVKKISENYLEKYKNKFNFEINEDKYEIVIKDDIIFHKENSESIIDFNFKDNVITIGTYYIKDLNFYMDAKVKTIKLDLNGISVEYKLWLQEEEIGNFIFTIISTPLLLF